MENKTSVIASEVEKFAAHAQAWWDRDGPLKTLHDINPFRVDFIRGYTELAGRRVLDVGCGGGILSEALARCGAAVTGIDVVEESLQAARVHAAESNLWVNYVCEPIEGFDAEPFDCITCLELLEHVDHPEGVIKHAARLLKQDGLLFLSTLNRTVKAYATAIIAAEYLLALLPRQTHDYDKFIRPSELSRVLRAEHFEVIGLTGMAYNPFTRMTSFSEAVDVNYLLVARRL